MTKKLSPERLTLYYSPTCPFCHRVLDALQALNMPPDLENETANGIRLKNTQINKTFQNELITGGGRKTVPCLAIEQDDTTQWMYESSDIIIFLQERL